MEKMSGISGRRLLRAGTAVGIASTVPDSIGVALAESPPNLERYVQPVPIPEVRDPDGSRNGADYYDVPAVEFETKLHPDLPSTTL